VSRRFSGDRWLLLGDAAAFIDPVFSTGVYLGMAGAFRAADTVDRALARRNFRRAAFSSYERWLARAVAGYRDFVTGFYTPEFAEVMMHPSDRLQLRQAVTSLLAGYGVDRFEVNWRIRVFRVITRLNRHYRLTPRLEERRRAAMELGLS
jgi:2-polyprenyl-6-methoxyphenol hydroxylase-like FAD-dependent oxidoreductase